MCCGCVFLSLTLLAGSLSAAGSDPKALYEQSTDALYNLDFNIALQGYETLTREHPENPDYWNALAASIWLRILYKQQKLNVESFSGSSLGAGGSRDSVDPAEEQRLRETIAAAIAKADALLEKNPKDIRALYAKGVADATLASFEASAKRAYFSAGSKAKAARDLHRQVLELDPNFDDALLSVGAYNYVLGVVPRFVRFLLFPLGIHGEGKDVGIRQLETAAAKGRNTSTDARMLLLVVYNRERQYDRALQVAERLHRRYPRNFIFELAEASIYRKMKRWDDAARTYQNILSKIDARQDGYERLAAHNVYLALASNSLDGLRFESALNWYAEVVKSDTAPPNDKANAYLWMGKIYDTSNRRAQAVEQYNAILGLNCDQDYKSQAEQYKRRPFK